MADIAAQVDDARNWQESRDAIVRAALTELAQHGASLDFVSVSRALGAAFGEAARQRAEVCGCDGVWTALAIQQSRMEAP
jgi:hypothetical protein